METNGLNAFQNNNLFKRLVTLSKIAIVFILSSSILLIWQDAYSFDLNRAESCLIPLLTSLIITDYVIKLSMQKTHFLRKIFDWPLFYHFKYLTRSCYLFNPIVLNSIAFVLPFVKFTPFDSGFNFILKLMFNLISFSAYIIFLYVLCVSFVVVFEIPLTFLFKNLYELLFGANNEEQIGIDQIKALIVRTRMTKVKKGFVNR